MRKYIILTLQHIKQTDKFPTTETSAFGLHDNAPPQMKRSNLVRKGEGHFSARKVTSTNNSAAEGLGCLWVACSFRKCPWKGLILYSPTSFHRLYPRDAQTPASRWCFLWH